MAVIPSSDAATTLVANNNSMRRLRTLDSGAHANYANRMSSFIEFETHDPYATSTGNQDVLVQGKGTIELEFLGSDGTYYTRSFTDVSYVPQLSVNTISMGVPE